MALKDWKKARKEVWVRKTKYKILVLYVVEIPSSSKYIVVLDYFDKRGWYIRGNEFLKYFKTKSQALKFAKYYMEKQFEKEYMRKH